MNSTVLKWTPIYYCSELHCTAVHSTYWSTIHCTEVHSFVLQWTPPWCNSNVLTSTPLYYSELCCTVIKSTVLQSTLFQINSMNWKAFHTLNCNLLHSLYKISYALIFALIFVLQTALFILHTKLYTLYIVAGIHCIHCTLYPVYIPVKPGRGCLPHWNIGSSLCLSAVCSVHGSVQFSVQCSVCFVQR